MNYQDLYNDIIEKLKRHERPLIKLTPEIIEVLKTEWQKALSGSIPDESAIKKILCILDNTQNMTSELNSLFFETFKKVKANSELLIYALAASQKHIINESLRSGIMIPVEYFETLKELLKNKNPEVTEWVLRTIESMGPLSLRLKKEVLEAKPGFLKIFNQHLKASNQIIELLEKQWAKFRL